MHEIVGILAAELDSVAVAGFWIDEETADVHGKNSSRFKV